MLSRIVNAILLVLVGRRRSARRHDRAPDPRVTLGNRLPLGLIGALARATPRCSSACACSATAASRRCSRRSARSRSILLFSQQSAGGSVLIPNNLLGQVWLVGADRDRRHRARLARPERPRTPSRARETA